ncbi:MAG: hypothetical protein JNK05_39420 [Myxococcales bacterium]|nr:hypothetical protein [Myxococcales bacterium]
MAQGCSRQSQSHGTTTQSIVLFFTLDPWWFDLIATAPLPTGFRRRSPRAWSRPLAPASALAGIIVCLYSSLASAQDFAGNYRITSDVTSAEVPEWGADCGQRPENHRGNTGRQVRVSADGSQLVVEDRPRMRSDGCWSQNPRTRRVSSSGSSPRWTTQCSSPAEDYQHEDGTYTTTLEGQRLTLRDRTVYRWNLQGSACRATITRTMVYERLDAPAPVADSGVAVTPRPPEDSGVRPARCALPGPATRLAIVAGRRSTTPGTRVCFRAQLQDVDGCAAINGTGAVITWSIARRNGGEAPAGEGGCVTVPTSDAAGTEYTVTANAANGFEERVVLRVVTPEESRSLVAQLIEESDASTSEDAAVAPRIAEGLGSVSGVVPTSAPPSGNRNAIVAILTAVAVLLAGVAFIVLRKKRPATSSDPADDPYRPLSAPSAPPPNATPSGGVGRARKDEAPIPVSSAPPSMNPAPSNLAQTMIGAMPAGTSGVIAGAIEAAEKRASQSSMAAVKPPTAQSAAAAPEVQPAKLTKRCPVCNQRFGTENAFCPDHGVALVDGAPGGEAKVVVATATVPPAAPASSAPVVPRTPSQPAKSRAQDDLARTQIAGSVGVPSAPPPALRCPTCGKAFGPGNVFCGEDGARLVEA